MNIRKNYIMSNYLDKLGYNFWEENIELPPNLIKIINSNLIEKNDCIILEELSEINQIPKFKSDTEKSEWEYNETHFHPDGYINKPEDEIEYLKLALECAKRLWYRFDEEFKSRNFRILVSYDETVEKDGEVESYGSSTVRFYQVRPGSDNFMHIDNLNDYKFDAILEIEK